MKLYTCETVADWLALMPRRVRQLRDEGIISERMPGLYEMKPTITRYIMYLRKGSGKTDLNDERALLTRAKREAADMENDLRRGGAAQFGANRKGHQDHVPEYPRKAPDAARQDVPAPFADGGKPGGNFRRNETSCGRSAGRAVRLSDAPCAGRERR